MPTPTNCLFNFLSIFMQKLHDRKTPIVYKNKKINSANFGTYNLNDYQVFLQLVSMIGGVNELGEYLQPDQLQREHTLTAKEWLKTVVLTKGCADPDTMEKYANYKNKALENRIKEFRELLKESDVSYGEQCVMPKVKGSYDLYKQIEVFDEHFNIK